MDGSQRRRYSSMLAARARRRRLIRRLSIVTPVAALFFYLAVRTRPTPSTPTPATPTLAWVPSDTPNFRRGKYAPFPFGARGHFWWTSQLSRFMFRPRPALQALVDAELAKIPRPFIGLHVGWCSVDGQLQDGTVYGHLNC